MTTLEEIKDHTKYKAGGVYCFRHKESGKCYVGRTQKIRTRYLDHINRSKKRRETGFHDTLKELGPESFDFLILELCDDLTELMRLEAKWVSSLDSVRNGYNINFPSENPKYAGSRKRATINWVSRLKRKKYDPNRVLHTRVPKYVTPDRLEQWIKDNRPNLITANEGGELKIHVKCV